MYRSQYDTDIESLQSGPYRKQALKLMLSSFNYHQTSMHMLSRFFKELIHGCQPWIDGN